MKSVANILQQLFRLFPKTFLFILLLQVAELYSQSTDSTAVYKIESVTIVGNKKTRAKIILRELSKNINDTLT